ncbi:hypothetical protein [Tumebacillus lipolyticus]|uniref:Uncharacterized protein n=1 Tax=Tumebacillus lipolyticus TaxID=1280370 RepID=A0ABW5A2K4_9BACL
MSAPYETTLTEAMKLAREELAALSELSRWITNVLTDREQVAVYTQNLRSLPVRGKLRFNVSEVDDDAIVRFEGMSMRVGLNQRKTQECTIGFRGNNAIVLVVENGGRFNWHVKINVDAYDPEGRLIQQGFINWEDGGNDNLWPDRRRVYIFKFQTV